MLNIVLSVILYITLAIIIFVGYFTLTRCADKKKTVFIAALAAAFMYTFGYLLEINALTTEEAFLAKKILYIGSSFSPPILLVFFAEYCGIKINRKLVVLLLAFALGIVALLWTTGSHKLFYTSFELNTSTAVNFLSKTSGPLHMVSHIYTFSCMIPSIFILIYGYKKLSVSRPGLILIIIGVLCCAVADTLYLIKPFDLGINYGPIAAGIYSVLFGVSIVKYDLLDIIPIASEMALSSMSDAFLLIDMNNKILDSNESAKELFPSVKKLNKFSSIAMIENWPDELLSIGDKTDRTSVQFKMAVENYYNARINPIIIDKDKILGHIILIQNITESVRMTKILEEKAYTDELTGILNRRHFFTLAEAQLERSNRLNENSYIILFDLDHFKSVNDTYGHSIGDKVLQCAVERVKGAIRPYDLFGRYGGEEFLLLISGINETDIISSTERIRAAIYNSPMIFDKVQLTISASFGIAPVLFSNNLADEHKGGKCGDVAPPLLYSDNLVDTIILADEALYRAKNEGRNRVVQSFIEGQKKSNHG